jgi:hypothetical protein
MSSSAVPILSNMSFLRACTAIARDRRHAKCVQLLQIAITRSLLNLSQDQIRLLISTAVTNCCAGVVLLPWSPQS